MPPHALQPEGARCDGDWLDQVEALDGGRAAPDDGDDRAAEVDPDAQFSPDIGFDRSINPYRGCEHGCIYCFARPTHAFHDLSPGRGFRKPAVRQARRGKLLHAALSRPGYECAPIAMGTNTDPYQPIEERWRITRSVIEVLLEPAIRSPSPPSPTACCATSTSWSGGEARLASVAISVTSLDPAIARTLEPRAPQPRKRLAAVKALNEAGVPAYVAIAPVVPQITDHELEQIVEAAAERAPAAVLPAGPPAARGRALVPRLARRALSRPRRQGHGDDPLAARRRDNDPNFFTAGCGARPVGRAAPTRFEIAAKRYGLPQAKFPLRSDLFAPPEGEQMRLLCGVRRIWADDRRDGLAAG